MNLETIRYVIPVNSFTQQRVDIVPTKAEPDIGIRWGNPSAFEHSNQGQQSSKARSGGDVETADGRDAEPSDPMIEERIFEGEIVKENWKKIDASTGGEKVIFRVNEQMRFENKRPVKLEIGRSAVDLPVFAEFNMITTYVLNFTLYPEGEWTTLDG